MRRVEWLGASALVLVMAACGSSTPTAPSAPDVSGPWLGEVTLSDFDGGECLAGTFHDIAGLPGQFHATLMQTGARVTATMDIDHTGAVCTFTGSIQGDQLLLAATNCSDPRIVALSCPNGTSRGMLPNNESLRATVASTSITGTALENDNVVVSGTTISVGQFTGRSTFVLSRP
jgi:hypothetical protein